MKKKIIFSIAAAAAILIANPGVNNADAASNDSVYSNAKVVYYQSSNLNQAEWNRILQKYVKRSNIQWNQEQVKQPNETQQNTVQKPAQTTPAQTDTTTSQLSAYEQKVVELTNVERSKNGLSALQVDVNLSKVAREKSSDMQRNNYFSHTSPTYGSPFDMMKKFGITYRTAGENIAMGQRTPEEVVQAWMNSEGHRANILNANYTHIGVGYVENGNYWTQQFIGK